MQTFGRDRNVKNSLSIFSATRHSRQATLTGKRKFDSFSPFIFFVQLKKNTKTLMRGVRRELYFPLFPSYFAIIFCNFVSCFCSGRNFKISDHKIMSNIKHRPRKKWSVATYSNEKKIEEERISSRNFVLQIFWYFVKPSLTAYEWSGNFYGLYPLLYTA